MNKMEYQNPMIEVADRELHEECGVFGVYGVENASSLAYYGLHSLQHRGQEGAGIVSVDAEGNFCRVKGAGLVTEVFREQQLQKLKGKMAIGHVRYATAGGGGEENIQPFLFHHNSGNFALAHNGNIVNAHLLKRYLEDRGSLFQSTSDSEVLAHLIKKETRKPNCPRIHSIMDALNMMEGAFAFLIMTQNRIYACRDKYGLRPLSIAKLGEGYVISSETCAFDTIGAAFIRDVDGMRALLAQVETAMADVEEIALDDPQLETRIRVGDILATQREVLSAMIKAQTEPETGVLYTENGVSVYRAARPLPDRDLWFERVWRENRERAEKKAKK